jgi:hypothetical protein
MCKPVYASRGRLKPLHAEGFGHHPDGEYYLRYAGKWEAVGNDAYVVLDRLAEKQRELRCTANAVPNSSASVLTKPSVVPMTLNAAIREYVTTGKAAEKDWRKHTVQCYTLGLELFRESCTKAYLDDVNGDDLRRFKVFLRKQQTQTKIVTKRISDRTIWNHFNNVVAFLNTYDRRNLIPQSEWPKYEEQEPIAYDPEDVVRLLPFANEDERDVVEFYLGVGFRNGEGTHTEWPDIDLRNKEVTIYSKPERYGWKVKDSFAPSCILLPSISHEPVRFIQNPRYFFS